MLPLLFLLFILLPIAELWLIIQIGGAIGVLPTLALLIVDSLVGAALARSQSRVAWERFNQAMAEGRIPAKEIFNGAMIILGGALLLTPGFITDVFGLLLLIPPTRAVIRGFLTRLLGKRGSVAFRVAEFGYARRPGGGPRPSQSYDYEGSASEVPETSSELDPRRETIGVPDSAVLDLAPGIRIAWDDLNQTRADLSAGEPSATWRLEGELGAGHTALRVLTGSAGKGTLLLLAAARPDEANGHDAENPRAILISRSGEAKAIEEALVSTQYSANGQIERLGLELYAEGDDYPVRGAGDARRASASDEGALRHEQAWLDFRLDGEVGDAILDILHS